MEGDARRDPERPVRPRELLPPPSGLFARAQQDAALVPRLKGQPVSEGARADMRRAHSGCVRLLGDLAERVEADCAAGRAAPPWRRRAGAKRCEERRGQLAQLREKNAALLGKLLSSATEFAAVENTDFVAQQCQRDYADVRGALGARPPPEELHNYNPAARGGSTAARPAARRALVMLLVAALLVVLACLLTAGGRQCGRAGGHGVLRAGGHGVLRAGGHGVLRAGGRDVLRGGSEEWIFVL